MKKITELKVTNELIEKIDELLQQGTTHRLTIILLLLDDDDIKKILYLYIKMNEWAEICKKTGFDEDTVKNVIKYIDECNRMIDSRASRRFRENRKEKALLEQQNKSTKTLETGER